MRGRPRLALSFAAHLLREALGKHVLIRGLFVRRVPSLPFRFAHLLVSAAGRNRRRIRNEENRRLAVGVLHLKELAQIQVVLLGAVEHTREPKVAMGLFKAVGILVLVIDELVRKILVLVVPILSVLVVMAVLPSNQSDASRALSDCEAAAHDASATSSSLFGLVQELGERLSLVEVLLPIRVGISSEHLGNLALGSIGVRHDVVLDLLQVLVVLLALGHGLRIQALELGLLLREELPHLLLKIRL